MWTNGLTQWVFSWHTPPKFISRVCLIYSFASSVMNAANLNGKKLLQNIIARLSEYRQWIEWVMQVLMFSYNTFACMYISTYSIYVDERNYQWRASLLVSVWPEQVNKPHLVNATNCWACRCSYRTRSYKCLDNKKPPPGIDIDEPSKCFHFILYQPLRKIYNSWRCHLAYRFFFHE